MNNTSSSKIEGWSLIPEDLKIFPSLFIEQLNASHKDNDGKELNNNGVKYDIHVVKNISLRNVESFDIFVKGWDFSISSETFETIKKEYPHIEKRIEKILYNQKSGTLVFTLKCSLQTITYDPQINTNFGNNNPKINREYYKTIAAFAKDIEKKNGGLKSEFLARPELNAISRIATDLMYHFKIKQDFNIYLIRKREEDKHRIVELCFKDLDGFINQDYLSQFMFQMDIKPQFTFNFKEKSLDCQIFFKKIDYVYTVSPQEKRKFKENDYDDEPSSDDDDDDDEDNKKDSQDKKRKKLDK